MPDNETSRFFDLTRLPLLLPVLSWLVGIVLTRSDLLPINGALWLGLLLLLILLQRRVATLLLIFGALWGSADLLLDADRVAMPEAWLKGPVHITAMVQQREQIGRGVRLRVNDVADLSGKCSRGSMYLYSYGRNTVPEPGQRIRATVKLRLPDNYQNPSAFDYRSWCFDHGIAAMGSLHGDLQIEGEVPALMMRLRSDLQHQLQSVEHGALLSALLLADRSGITADQQLLYAASGTAHLLAISGLHVGMATAWFFALLYWLLTRRESWIVRLPVKKVALLLSLLGGAGYAAMAGWPLPALRAMIMLTAAAIAWIIAARYEGLNILLAALALILFFDPTAVTSLSLWLSFVATAALLLWSSHVDRVQGWRARFKRALGWLLLSSTVALLATLPIVVSSFGSVPLYAIPANLLLVPLFGVWVLPLALLGELAAISGAEMVARPLLQLSGVGVAIAEQWLTWITALPAGRFWGVTPPLWLSLGYGAGLLLACLFWMKQQRRYALLLSAAVISIYLTTIATERSVVVPHWYVWDVGQGAASMLQLPGNEVVAIDAPGRFGSRFDGGMGAAAAMRAVGVTHADLLIVSHAQSDHIGGTVSLIKRLNRVDEIWLPDTPTTREHRTVVQLSDDAGRQIRWLARGDVIQRSGWRATVLWPPRGLRSANGNNDSLVLKIELANGKRLLLPGDIEKQVERQLLKKLHSVDAMLMPHHGSRSSSTQLFVEAVAPSIAVAQAGSRNRYGFPHGAVINRYKDVGAALLSTADGAIELRLGDDIEAKQWAAPVSGRRALAVQWLKGMSGPEFGSE